MSTEKFQKMIRVWFRENGRDLPWRRTRDPYRILISEVMLQQTQVSRVRPKYRQFIRAFPSIAALARAPLARVLTIWQGMGYNRRVVYVKRLAAVVRREYRGRIPRDALLLRRLPGIGDATSGAIAAFAFGEPIAFLETNIRRVYLHFFFPERKRVRDAEILAKIAATLPQSNVREWYYALMDYGALALGGIENPNRRSAHYARQSPFRGSRRELRGRIMKAVIKRGGVPIAELHRQIRREPHLKRPIQRWALDKTISQLIIDGLIQKAKNHIEVARTLHVH